MTLVSPLRLEPEAPAEAASPRDTKVFVRVIPAPPGLPWDQARSAKLEALHGAPLPIGELQWRLRRLEAWRPGQPARFAAMYVMARDIDGVLSSRVDVEGRAFREVFRTPASARAQQGLAVFAFLGSALVGLSIVAALGTALVRRTENDAALGRLELQAASRLHAARASDKLRLQAAALASEPQRGAPVSDLVADLSWAAAHRDPSARLDRAHWEPGLLVVRAHGEAPPFVSDRNWLVRRATRPAAPGVWLWGAMRRTSEDSPTGPEAWAP